jgi:uncharacterized protein
MECCNDPDSPVGCPMGIRATISGMQSEKNNSMSRFEVEENGETAYLEFELDKTGWITLWHTEVPEALRGRGMAGILAKTALEYARDHQLKVDVVCPMVEHYLSKNPEFQSLVGK